MRRVSKEELKERFKNRMPGEKIDLSKTELFDMDLKGWDLSNTDFTVSALHRINLNGANMQDCCVKNAWFDDCTLRGTDLKKANLQGAALRYCDMTGCHIEGADLLCAVLEHARLEQITADEETRWWRLRCPEQGAFLGYKKCVNDRLVQLLIPADALRTSATAPSCRCSKAKVLTIKSFDYRQRFSEAWSLVDEDFVYRVGEWVEVKNFNKDRWMDSTTGIHFWLTREEAKAY